MLGNELWIWIGAAIGVAGLYLVIRFWKEIAQHSKLIEIALSTTNDVVEYLHKQGKISDNLADMVNTIHNIGVVAVTAAEEKANAGEIPKEKKFEVAHDIAKAILKQKNIPISDEELNNYISSALNIARATGLLSEQKKKTTKKKKLKPISNTTSELPTSSNMPLDSKQPEALPSNQS